MGIFKEEGVARANVLRKVRSKIGISAGLPQSGKNQGIQIFSRSG